MAQIIKAPLIGVLEIFPRIFEDQRGYFFESYREDWLQSEGVTHGWVQDNQSYSQKRTVRGLHFQKGEFAQAKLVRVIQGRVLDVVVDLRRDSPTFGEIYSTILDAQRNNLMYVPTGFAHGFSVLEDSVFAYKCSNYYHKESEGGILWNDPALAIDWQIDEPITSEKDAVWPTLEEFRSSEGGL
ncbi:dTDP-4-dehydrorhamnose 3,5-epimerase [Algoriphagus ratkowskyi]|uniref:dTDP-4-dehydrorhamnose 3,5-epimerase n=1 Tax=Algoriphagus ratkowskyi TaxID=57028 RepID=A0A2W7T9S0_9BACT|nr:dTDP-4-dehydrorhamnose 3,5-epimerase [Algoriphagus ratkowskyi]PZX59912.1 dTDP-4-dehydrorhamnose 3,5-epimerase [Algoriphagus ratkowskyi]TXD78385.1 dTDP-4-dehydrorhamnose 3,5-epimerase [Algoriphagus ratkowskyi]